MAEDRPVPVLTPATIDPSLFTGSTQPELTAGDELLLRPWRIEDASAVLQVYDDPLIRQWHARSLVDLGESRKLIIDWRSGWRQATAARALGPQQASCRAAEKAGYPAEGTRRSAALHPDGWHDMHVHALVRPE
jgi:RimJ/RimL family protein N-acetyltransferase